MQLFKKQINRKAYQGLIITTLFISILFTAGSCKAEFSTPLQSYLSAVAGGKVLAVSIDGARVEYGTAIDFSYQKIGTTSLAKTITVENVGQIEMKITTIFVDMMGISGSPYTVDLGELELPLTLQRGESSTFDVLFNPTVTGPISGGGHEELLNAAITIASNDAEYSAFDIPLMGTGALGGIVVLHDSTEYSNNGDPYLFAVVEDYDTGGSTGPNEFSLKNVGNVDLVINGFTPSGMTSDFVIVDDFTGAFTIPAGEIWSFTADFVPTADGGYPLAFTIESDDKDESSFVFNLRGATSTPKLIDDVALWLDASAISTADDCVTEDGGTTYFVKEWPDKSSVSTPHNALAYTAGSEVDSANVHKRRLPQYVSNSINGNPVVRFVDEDGEVENNTTTNDAYYNGDILYIAGQVLDYVQGMSVFIVTEAKGFDLPGDDVFADDNKLDPGGRNFMTGSNTPYLRLARTYFYNDFMSMTHSTSTVGIAPIPDNVYLWTNIVNNVAEVNADRHRLWINGNYITPTKIFDELLGIRLYNVCIGNNSSNFNSSTYPLNGDIAEILIFSKSLTTEEVDMVHTYLSDRYAISLY